MKFTTKPELLAAILEEHREFLELTATIPAKQYRKAGVWGDGWNVLDLFAHLTEWEQMFLKWHREGCHSGKAVMPAAGYKWNETPALNRAIWRKHHRRPWKDVRKEFEASFAEILAVTQSLSETELFTLGHFTWTGKHNLATYLVPNTSSHYRTATKILKRWLKGETRSAAKPAKTRAR